MDVAGLVILEELVLDMADVCQRRTVKLHLQLRLGRLDHLFVEFAQIVDELLHISSRHDQTHRSRMDDDADLSVPPDRIRRADVEHGALDVLGVRTVDGRHRETPGEVPSRSLHVLDYKRRTPYQILDCLSHSKSPVQAELPR